MPSRASFSRLGLVAVATCAVLACTSTPPSTPVASTPEQASTSTSGPAPLATSAPTLATTITAAPATPEHRPGPQTQAPPAPTPPTLPPQTPTPTATPAPSPLEIDWQQVQNPGLGAADEIIGSAAAGNRLVVIGGAVDNEHLIWTSGNGRDWSQADLPTVPGYLHLTDVTALGNGFLAVGATDDNDGNSTAVALTSTDGSAWQQLGSATLAGWTYENVAVVGSAIVVVADSSDGSQTAFVTSHDGGQTWSQPSDPDGALKYFGLELTATDTDFWEFAQADGSLQPEIAIWRSTDGDTWTNVGTLPDSAGAARGAIHVANGPLGWVVMAPANGHHKKNFAWWSADGLSWQDAPQAPFGVEDIFADDAGFIAVGNWFPNGSGCAIDPTQAEGLTFTSTDGLLWRRMSEDGWMGNFIDELRRYGRTLIGIGLDFTQNNNGAGAVWTAKLPDLSSDTGPVPTNPPMPKNGC